MTRFITCRDDQTVADASYRQRINIPLDCRDGACGTCKALCESGSYDGGTYIEDALPPDEAAAGYVLPCSMRPRSDLVLQIASTSDVAKTRRATYTGTSDAARSAVGHHRRPRRRDPQPRRVGVPARAVRQHRGAGHRPDPLVLVLQRPPRRSAHLPGEADPGRRNVGVPRLSARPSATPSPSPAPTDRSSCARPTARCCCWPAAPGWRRCCRCCAPCETRLEPAQGAPDLRCQHRRRPGGARRDRGDRLALHRIHLGLLRLRPRTRLRRTRAT